MECAEGSESVADNLPTGCMQLEKCELREGVDVGAESLFWLLLGMVKKGRGVVSVVKGATVLSR